MFGVTSILRNKMTYIPNENSDQSGHSPSLISVFTGRTCHFVSLSCGSTLISCTFTGLKTVQGLLKSADEFSSNKIQRTFRKFGNYQTAIDDFYSLKPTDVRTVKMANGVSGRNEFGIEFAYNLENISDLFSAHFPNLFCANNFFNLFCNQSCINFYSR